MRLKKEADGLPYTWVKWEQMDFQYGPWGIQITHYGGRIRQVSSPMCEEGDC